jgi:hypothetical protein
MSHDTLATILWTMLGVSVVLTVFGIVARSAWMLFVAAAISLVFGIAAILSVGIFVLALAVAQLVIGIGIRRQTA